ncbi:unnamed protein product [Closterium sp. NIES-65]|nr:unnamed protein product [Closterium sp. NIES-65]
MLEKATTTCWRGRQDGTATTMHGTPMQWVHAAMLSSLLLTRPDGHSLLQNAFSIAFLIAAFSTGGRFDFSLPPPLPCSSVSACSRDEMADAFLEVGDRVGERWARGRGGVGAGRGLGDCWERAGRWPREGGGRVGAWRTKSGSPATRSLTASSRCVSDRIMVLRKLAQDMREWIHRRVSHGIRGDCYGMVPVSNGGAREEGRRGIRKDGGIKGAGTGHARVAGLRVGERGREGGEGIRGIWKG